MAATNGDHQASVHGRPDAGIKEILRGNEHWAQAFKADPANAERIEAAAKGQAPRFFWIGCCDSRVPPTTITDKTIGDIFVHRNIANMVRELKNKHFYSDITLWSSVDYAVANFPLTNIIVCGHTDCGGAKAALHDIENDPHLSETIKEYLRPLVHLRKQHQSEFKSTDGITDPVELKAIEQHNAALLAKLNVDLGSRILENNSEVREKKIKVYGLMFDVRTLDLEIVHAPKEQL